MLLAGSSGDSCTKHSEGCSSGTSTPHSDPNHPYTTQSKQNGQNAYPQYPPGKYSLINTKSKYDLYSPKKLYDLKKQ